MAGRTHCDELSLQPHRRERALWRAGQRQRAGPIPGGSSNGSAAAVAGGRSTSHWARLRRLGAHPRELLWNFGLRPTWGRVSLDEAVPFGPSFDVAGWFARDAGILAKVGRELLADGRHPRPQRLLVARAPPCAVEPAANAALAPRWRGSRGSSARVVRSRLRRRACRLVRDVPHHPGCRGVGERRRVGQRGQAAARARRQGAHRMGGDGYARHAGPGQYAPRGSEGAHGSASGARRRALPDLATGSAAARTPVDKSRSSTATRPCACCASRGSRACRSCQCRWRPSTACRSASPSSAGRAPTMLLALAKRVEQMAGGRRRKPHARVGARTPKRAIPGMPEMRRWRPVR